MRQLVLALLAVPLFAAPATEAITVTVPGSLAFTAADAIVPGVSTGNLTGVTLDKGVGQPISVALEFRAEPFVQAGVDSIPIFSGGTPYMSVGTVVFTGGNGTWTTNPGAMVSDPSVTDGGLRQVGVNTAWKGITTVSCTFTQTIPPGKAAGPYVGAIRTVVVVQ